MLAMMAHTGGAVFEPRDFVKNISPYRPGRPIEEVARELNLTGKILKMASNENPLGASPMAVAAMKKALKESSLYPDDNCYFLKKKLAAMHGVKPGNIFIGNGSVELMPLTTLAYLGPGTSAVVSEGAFIWYRIATSIASGQLVEVPMRSHTHDLKAMGAAIKDNTRLLFIANPNNPTGTVVFSEDMDELMRQVPNRVLVILDEAYHEYVEDPRYPDSLTYLRDGWNILILRTFSKIYGLAGVRLGYGIASEEVIDSLMKIRISFNVGRISQVAGMAALDDREFVEKARRINEEGKAFLYKAFTEMGLSHLPTWANFIFVDFEMDALPLFEELQRKGIITRTVREYGIPHALRITIGTEKQNRRLVKALKEALSVIRKK